MSFPGEVCAGACVSLCLLAVALARWPVVWRRSLLEPEPAPTRCRIPRSRNRKGPPEWRHGYHFPIHRLHDQQVLRLPGYRPREGPLTTGGKFRLFVNQSISPPYIIVAAINAAYSQARDVPSAYGQGWDAYGGRFGQPSVELLRMPFQQLCSCFGLHQDPRFFPQSHPSLWGSMKYSAQRLFVTRKDAGVNTFNTSQIVGTLAAESLANVYLPVSEQTAAKPWNDSGPTWLGASRETCLRIIGQRSSTKWDSTS